MKNIIQPIIVDRLAVQEAEALYKQILTRAQERELGAVDDEKKSIRQVSANCEEKKNATDAGTENGGQNVVKADKYADVSQKLVPLHLQSGCCDDAVEAGRVVSTPGQVPGSSEPRGCCSARKETGA